MDIQFAFANPRKGKKSRRKAKRSRRSPKKVAKKKASGTLKKSRKKPKRYSMKKRAKKFRNPERKFVEYKDARGKKHKELVGHTYSQSELNQQSGRIETAKQNYEKYRHALIHGDHNAKGATRKLKAARLAYVQAMRKKAKMTGETVSTVKTLERHAENKDKKILSQFVKSEGSVAKKKKAKKKKASKKKKSKKRKASKKRKSSKKRKASKKRKSSKKRRSAKSAKKRSSKRRARKSARKHRSHTVRTQRNAKRKFGGFMRKAKKGSQIHLEVKPKGRKKKSKKYVIKRTNPYKRRNPVADLVKDYTGHNVQELATLAAGGALYSTVNSLSRKGLNMISPTIASTLDSIPVLGPALIPLLAGALLNKFGGKVPSVGKYLEQVGEGLVAAGVVQLGAEAGKTILPMVGLSGITYYPNMNGLPQLGSVNYYPNSMNGVDYTPNQMGIMPTLGSSPDFGKDADYGGGGGYTQERPFSSADFGADDDYDESDISSGSMSGVMG